MNTNGLKGREARLKVDIMQIIAERDESIKSTFGAFDQKIGQVAQMLDFKLAVAFTALEELGFSQDKLNKISESLQAKMQGNNVPQGGDTNVQEPYTEAAPSGGGSNPAGGTVPESKESGEEHFG